ncbi:hypothetical protein H0264_18580 [Nocardia huaxiensis]|uniref:Uncharacterized protein n=1 Tax=Nocardia huaxiensis TaxID=2755382 RepID=A0A7D6ZM76_9NOCA|nr:hypothetical protein [Nocardia huaxiensis]QLY33967.1 hypothetical protein H0264_18580 [Nocardia huaxiensis]
MSEMDEISRDTGRTFRDVLTVAGQWLRTLRERDHHAGRLTRKQRRELAEHITAQIGAQRIDAAWYTKRVTDYRDAYATARYRHATDPFYTDQDAAHDRERLSAMRFGIEETLLSSSLETVQRGQVVLALDHAQRHPQRGTPTVAGIFQAVDERSAREARYAAVESEQWVEAGHREMEQMAASMTIAQPRPSAPAPQQAPANTEAAQPQSPVERDAAIDRDIARANAAQTIRHVEYTRLRDQASGRRPDPYGQIARRDAAEQARRAGMTTEEIRWEFANAETNSRCQVAVVASARDGSQQGTRGYFATEADAAAWTRDAVHTHAWAPGSVLSVRARESGRRHPFYQAEGSPMEVGRSLDAWNQEIGREHTDPPDQDRTREKAAPAAGSEDLERRVLMLQRGLDAVTADRDTHKQQAETMRAELDTLKNTQLRTNHDLRELREQLDTAHADRDRYRGERDEAVRKLARNTPEQDRYGSSERVAREQADTGTTMPPPSNGAGQPRPRPERSR